MDSLRTQDLAQILGLYSPWVIKEIDLASDAESITISIEKQIDKSRFSFLASNKFGIKFKFQRSLHILARNSPESSPFS